MTKKEPLVSIGIPTYNRKEGLKHSLECFTNQTYKNIEIIVSDNCSPDDPSCMVKEFIRKDKRIQYYRQDQNRGMTFNGEFVWKKAKGEFFILGSDDDWWSNNFISELIFLLQKEKDAVCAFSNFEEVDSEWNKIEHYPFHYPLLKEFEQKCRVTRLRNFILQKECDGKANVHRSICNRNVFLKSIEKLNYLGLAGCWAFDQLLVFAILIEGQLVVSDKLLFKCSVGNQKHYIDPSSRIRYLEGYEKIIDDSFKAEEAFQLKQALNLRYYDNKIGFYKEFVLVLKGFIYKEILQYNNYSLDHLTSVKKFVDSGNNIEAYKLAEQFKDNISISGYQFYKNKIKKIFISGNSEQKLALKIGESILKKIRSYEEN